MLALKLFYPAMDKVRQVEFHPVLPWVVSATKSDHVAVWDWRTKQLVWEAHLGGSEDDLCTDAEMARVHLRDPAFSPNPSLLHPTPSGPKKDPSGHVRDVRFLDCDVAQVQLTWQHTTASGCGTPPPRAEDIKALRGQRLLVIACEFKLVVVDLASKRVLELGKGVFEGKSPASLAFLFRAGGHGHGHGHAGHGHYVMGSEVLLESPVLAVGCSDGIVRCVQLFPTRPIARLVSAHKTAVVALAVLGLRGHRHDTLAVGHQGGRVVLFEPLAGAGRHPGSGPSAGASAAPADVTPRAEYRAHERELLPGSLAVVPVDEDPEGTRYQLFSAGSDNRLCGMEPASLKGPSPDTGRIKVEGASVTCMAHWPRGWVGSGVHSLLLGTEAGQLLLAHPVTGSVRRAVDLNGLVPAGGKRSPKVYGIHVHPLMPSVVAAATNSGTAILVTTSPHQPLAAAALPLAAPSQALRDEGAAAAMGVAFGGSGGGGVTYVTALGAQVLCVTASTLPNQELSDFPPNQVMGKLEVAGGTPGGRPLVTVSHDGGYVAVAWPGARRYAIYQQGASAWREVARGTGSSVAWHSCLDTFAALEEDGPAPPPPPPPPPPGSKAAKEHARGGKAEKQAEAARAAAEAAARAAAASAAVRIKDVVRGTGGAASVAPAARGALGLDLRGDSPTYVQGGPLLAVTVRRTMKSEAANLAAPGSHAPALLLFDWGTGRRVGPELPEPLALSWDPSRTMLALAYPSQLLIVRSRPDFQVAASLPVCGAESLEWSARQLFIATPSHILTALLAPAPPALPPSAAATATTPPPRAPPARLITLAGPGVPPASTGGAGLALEGFLPPPAIRPPGPLALLGPRDGCLWMVGVLGQPMALGLSHPGLRACCMVAAGDLQGAVSLASRALAPELQDQLAALMTEMDGLRGAAAAVHLPGISLACELRLRAALRHWQQAVEAAEALLLGYTTRPPPGQFRSAAAAAAFAGGGGGIYGSVYGGGPQLGDEFVDLSLAVGGAPANAPAHPEDLDWTQPLRAASSSARAAATAVVAARRPGGGGGAPSAATVQLVLGLLEDLLRSAMYDVIRHLVKPLLVHAVHLGGEQLQTLSGIMAQAGMNTDLPSLLHSVAAGADSSGREAAALLAALLSGHTGLVADSLREDGAAPLAALQAQTYGLSSAAENAAAWRRQLAAAAPPGAAAVLGRLEVSASASS